MAVAKPERASRPVSNILRMADLYLSDARSRFTWGGGSVCVCIGGGGGGGRDLRHVLGGAEFRCGSYKWKCVFVRLIT